MSDRPVDPQRIGRDHGYVVGRVPELSQGRARLVVNVATVAGAHGHAARGLGLGTLSDDPGAGRRGQQYGRRRRQRVRGADATATASEAAATGAAAATATGTVTVTVTAAVTAGTADRAADARDAGTGTARAADALPGHRPRDAMALPPLAHAPVYGQVPAMELDIRHRPGRRTAAAAAATAVDWRPAVVAAAQRGRGVPQVPVMVRDQRRGAILSGQHGLAGRRRTGVGRWGGHGRRRRPDPRSDDGRRALDEQRSGFLAATVTAVRHGLGHCLRAPSVLRITTA